MRVHSHHSVKASRSPPLTSYDNTTGVDIERTLFRYNENVALHVWEPGYLISGASSIVGDDDYTAHDKCGTVLIVVECTGATAFLV